MERTGSRSTFLEGAIHGPLLVIWNIDNRPFRGAPDGPSSRSLAEDADTSEFRAGGVIEFD